MKRKVSGRGKMREEASELARGRERSEEEEERSSITAGQYESEGEGARVAQSPVIYTHLACEAAIDAQRQRERTL